MQDTSVLAVTQRDPHPTAVQDPALAERLADEQLRIVWSHASVGTIAATVFALLLAAKLHTQVAPMMVNLWVLMKLLVAVPRIGQAYVYSHNGYPGGQRWRNVTYSMLGLDGLVWGIGGAGVMSEADPTSLLVMACLACIAAVATFGLQVRVLATAAYVVPMLLLPVLALFLRGDEFGLFCGTGLLIFLGVLLSSAFRSEKRLAEVFLLRLQAAKIAQDLQDALELARRNADEREQALELAQRQSAVKTQFLATMSHELRTPLHGILGLARLLHVESSEPATRRRIELIEGSGTHLLELINDLLDISRIESGHLHIHDADFDLTAEIGRIVDVHTVRALGKGLALNTDIRLPRPCWVHGDASRARQVLHNLLGNAVKFTERGSVSLSVDRVEGSDMVRFEVRDSGVGIPNEELPRVFQAFQQLEGHAARPFDGTGLGLTIAREIARAMKGDIAARSAVGVGSVFSFTARLPLAQAHELPAPALEVPRSEPSAHAHQVLLAEDNDVNALIATAFLERAGVHVERVMDGREAVRLALAEAGRPDLILMDCLMPNLDGYAATRMIRAHENAHGLKRVPVIAITATASENDRQLCRDAGMDDFLAKPFTDAQLADVMSVWLGDPAPLADLVERDGFTSVFGSLRALRSS